jgi:hypothetical protein
MTTEQFDEIIKILRETRQILEESNNLAEAKEKMRMDQMAEGRSL